MPVPTEGLKRSVAPGQTPGSDSTAEITVRLYGRLLVSRADVPLKLSSRAVTLLVYLVLEGQPLHRTAAARLLWPTAGRKGLQNLRVELSALRRQGIDLSPHRSPFLSLRAATDLERGPAGGPRDTPLLDFNTLDNPVLAEWLGAQRRRLEQLGLARTARPGPVAPAPDNAAEVEPGAGPLGWLAEHLRPTVVRLEAGALTRPQLLLYVGPLASGRRDALRRLMSSLGREAVELPGGASLDGLFHALLLGLRPHLDGEWHQEADRLLQGVLPAGETARRLERLLWGYRGPLTVTLLDAERLSAATAPLLDLLMSRPHPTLTVAVTTPAGAGELEGLLGRHIHPAQFHEVTAPLLTPESLPGLPGAPGTGSQQHDRRLEIIRQAEGWLMAAVSPEVLGAPPGLRARLAPEVKRVLRAQVASRGVEPAHLQALAGLPGPFAEASALATLAGQGLTPGEAAALLERALRAGVLERVPAVVHVHLPGVRIRPPDGPHALAFSSELQRAALASSLEAGERSRLRRQAATPPAGPPPRGPAVSLRRIHPERDPRQGPAHTHRLPGGYLLLVRAGSLSVVRLGAPGHTAPKLWLSLPPTADGLVLHYHPGAVFPGPAPVHVLAHAPHHPAPWSTPPEPGGWYHVVDPPPGERLLLEIQASDLVLDVAGPTPPEP